VIKEGKGKKPSKEDVVEVHYKGTLIDGTEFDSSYKRNKPAQFPVGAVIPGWTEALQMMQVGSKYELYIPPELGYGERGNPRIPGNSVLVFEVELISIQDKGGKDKKK
jgi:FKBP-type peptidyl-prolyl cis-trans isomerase